MNPDLSASESPAASARWTLAGRVCIVTGASRGIGLETARGLAALGAHVVLVSRRRETGEAARESVLAARREAEAKFSAAITGAPRASHGTGDPTHGGSPGVPCASHGTGDPAHGGSPGAPSVHPVRVPDDGTHAELHLADFASLAEVRRLAADLAARHPRIHVLVNNAGIYVGRREVTVDGFERTFAVNHLAPFLLTNLLLPNLRAADRARVVTVSSAAHRRARRFDDPQSEGGYRGWLAYAKSKTANILFALELARRLAGTGVTSNALHPGTVDTGLLRDAFAGLTGMRSLYRLMRPFVRTVEAGARTSLHLAASPDAEGITGCYFEGLRAVEPSRPARDPALARDLWERSAQWVGIPG